MAFQLGGNQIDAKRICDNFNEWWLDFRRYSNLAQYFPGRFRKSTFSGQFLYITYYFRTLSKEELLDEFSPIQPGQEEANDSSLSDMTQMFLNSSLEDSRRSFDQDSNFQLSIFYKHSIDK